MHVRLTPVLSVLVAALLIAAYSADSTAAKRDPDGLVVHEWGTFTTVAGPDGTPVEWLPLSGPADLPCFVERFSPRNAIKALTNVSACLTYDAAKRELPGRVRMETPVLYFYSPAHTRANVRVAFPQGLITEWYPRASVFLPPVSRATLQQPRVGSVIDWRNVEILPDVSGALPTESTGSHYYAARATDAAPVRVNGQIEKFLFYRGVAGFDVPLAAVALGGGAVRVTTRGSRELRSVMLVANTNGMLRYRLHGTLRGEATLAASSDATDRQSLRLELERALVGSGLYPKEARAMVETWRDSWLEEGTRVFYILSPRSVDEVLPLTVDPMPREVRRVFVGRMEVITPEMTEAVGRAIDNNDEAALARYGRFLGPIAERIAAGVSSPSEQARVRSVADAAFRAYASRGPGCSAQ